MFAIEPFDVLTSSSSKYNIFIFVNQSLLWNALKVVRINHRFFVQSIIKIATPSQYFLKRLEFELSSLKVYLQMNDLNPTFYKSWDSDFFYYA